MRNPSLIAISLVVFAITGFSHADPGPPERVPEKIRKEFRGAAAPDHLVFAALFDSTKATAEWNREIALGIVQKHMHLDSEKAVEVFLSRMVAVVGELESEHDKVWDETVCRPDAPRSKEALFQMLDRVDDLTEIKTHNVYVKFISSLDQNQQETLTAWLKDAKEGFYYRTAEHRSLYENTSVDVIEHIDMVCTMRRAEG